MRSEGVLIWNIRGLNSKLHRDALRELVIAEKPSIVYLQETKLNVISNFDVVQLLGAGFDYAFLPAMDIGILVAWHSAIRSASSKSALEFSVLVKLRQASGGVEWWLMTVYGPANDVSKPAFLAELHQLRLIRSGPWLLAGDFNMIYMAVDKNNNRLNHHRMVQFWRLLNDACLKELHLTGRLFTWSSGRAHPTLERIDHTFISEEWEEVFLGCDLQALSFLCSNHTPLLVRRESSFAMKKRFHFRSFWLKCQGFQEVVQMVWHFNFTPVLNWKITHIHMIIHIYSHIQYSHPIHIILIHSHTHKSHPYTSKYHPYTSSHP
jgi:exonuclease III